MISIITLLNKYYPEKIIGCCCGHGKYPMTIVVRSFSWGLEILTNRLIKRTRRFYVKDKQGYFFIPESIETTKQYFIRNYGSPLWAK
jgi:hypothetical protein